MSELAIALLLTFAAAGWGLDAATLILGDGPPAVAQDFPELIDIPIVKLRPT